MYLDEKLREIVIHATGTTAFYKESASSAGLTVTDRWTHEDFLRMPLVTKKCIQENYNSFISDLNKPAFGKKSADVVRTSGSTGEYLRVLWNPNDYNRSLMSLWMIRRKFYNILPSDRYCYFYATEYAGNDLMEPREQSPVPGGRNIGFCKSNFTHDKLRKFYMAMYDFDPVWMMVQPSIALLLAEIAATGKLPPLRSLKYIEIHGELLTDGVREIIEGVFRCKTANIYGCVEVNWIAIDRGQDRLHCLTSNVFVEIIKDGVPAPYGQEGEIYVTSLCNHAMPFIRYQTGDTGILHKDGQSGLCCIELTSGRISQYVVTKKDNLPSYVFQRPIETINNKLGNAVRQFRVTQNGIDDFSVELSLAASNPELEKSISRLFLESLHEPELSTAKWSFLFPVMIFPDAKTGKLASFVQNTTL